MSFDHSQFTYGHVITFPSVWLPPSNTSKIMLLSHCEQQAYEYLHFLQERYPDINWAFYLAPDSSNCDKELLDWLWINQLHMDAIVGCCDHSFMLELWMSSTCKNKFLLRGSHNPSNILAELYGHKLWNSSDQLWDYIVNNNFHNSQVR
jgi:hypothetical protein